MTLNQTGGTQTSGWLGWFLAIGVAAGPLVGYILSRGPGLPNYDDDKGNWTEPLGLISLVVEGVLLILAIALFLRTARVGSAATGSAGSAGSAGLSAQRVEA